MASTWAYPLYSRSEVNRAGQAFVAPESSPQEREIALSIINNWRSSHAFPLNTLQVSLRHRAQQIEPDATIAQRIKRLPSIVGKLERFHSMQLARMQDLGGCRAIVGELDALRDLKSVYDAGNGRHALSRFDDYVFEEPKDSGYRGLHYVYTYNSDRKTTYNGLKIEIQIRTRLQHAWATAVETVGFFTRQALKSSSGEGEWLHFFALMSSVIAILEDTPVVPGTHDSLAALTREIKPLARNLSVVERLSAYGQALRQTETSRGRRDSKYLILELDAVQESLVVYSFENLQAATDQYGALERATVNDSGTDVVLVSVESAASLRRAYPN
jgi:hypothetical protein